MMPRFIILTGVVSTLCLFAVLSFQPTPKLTSPTTHSYSSTVSVVPDPIEFLDVSLSWGSLPTHTQSSKHLTAITETLGSGVCAFDFNQDGWMDLFFVGGSGHSRYYGRKAWWNKANGNRLLLNLKGQGFQDITKQAGLEKRIWGMGCTVADLNNDGLSDLIVTGVAGNALFQNSGDGSFIDITDKSGISGNHWSTGANIADFNQDGLLDIYISNYIRYKKGARTFERTSGFQTTESVAFDPTLYDPEPNQLFINRGDFTFEDIADEAGVTNSIGRSLGARWIDLNKDGWLDLVVINDKNSSNQVFINHAGESFSRGKETFAPFEIAGSHDLVAADFDNSGQDSFFVSRGMSQPPTLLAEKRPSSELASGLKEISYIDSAWSRNLAQARLLPFTAWGSAAGDFNNDGFLDLYVANGMVLPDIDSHFVTQAQRNSLFVNQGDGQFKQTPSLNRSQQHPYSSRGVITVDLNNDGKLELVISNNNDPLQILENQANNDNSWIGFDLITANTGVEVYGAQLELTTELFTIKRTLTPNQSYLSQGDPRIHIGLGDSKQIHKLTIYWPDGQISNYKTIKPNQYFSISRANNTALPIVSSQSPRADFSYITSQLDEASQITYSKVLLQATTKKVNPLLMHVWRNGTDLVKTSILDHIKRHWGLNHLAIVRDALLSNTKEIRLTGVEILKQAELELSVVWLLPLLNDVDPKVQCKTAETFGYFFDEEEAVTHRKKLAISPLIKLLGTGAADAKICAANALASAENKRAISPLLKVATTAEEADVRAASIRALGLIRDPSINKALISLIQSSETEAPVIAALFIALKRLNEPSLDTLFEFYFSSKDEPHKNPSRIIKSFHVLTLLINNQDGIVFPKRLYRDKLSELINNNIVHEEQNVVIASLQAIGIGKLEHQLDNVKAKLDHPDTTIQLNAFNALTAINTPPATKLLENRLQNESFSTLNKIIALNKNAMLSLSDIFFTQLAKRMTNSSELFNSSMELLQKLHENSANKLFNQLIEQSLSEKQHLQLFGLCSSGKISIAPSEQFTGISSKHKYPSADLHYAHASCHFSSNKSNKRNFIQLNNHLQLKTLLAKQGWNEDKRSKLILAAAKNNSVIAKTMLLKDIILEESPSITDKEKSDALTILATHGLIPNIKKPLWALLKNPQKSRQLRLEVASHLLPIYEERVLSYLDNQLFSHD